MLCGFSSAYSQDCYADKIEKQGVRIDSLEKECKRITNKKDSLLEINETINSSNKQLEESKKEDSIKLKNVQSDLDKEKSKNEADSTSGVAKNNTITDLNKQLTQKDGELKTSQEESKKTAATEKENGKKEVLDQLINTYKNKDFDDLINYSSITSLKRDKQLIGKNADIKQIIDHLEIYFNASNLMTNKFNAINVNEAIEQLKHIKQTSKLVATLKDNLGNFKTVNENLNITIQNIVSIDKKEFVKSMGDQVVKLKLNKILGELSRFIFDYNFNFVDYPYLSDIVLEIIKRKQPNPDAEISDLLKKL
jgi:hypothetical protein